MSSSEHDHDHDHDDDHANDAANDNGSEHEEPGSKLAPAPAGGALTSLAALQTALAGVNTAAIIGRTGLPMMLFKAREGGTGTWGFGQKRTIPEEGSKWAANPMTFQWGYISFGENKKVVGEQIVSVSQPKPDFSKLPDTGFPWQEEWSVNLKCLDGADAGVEVVFKATTDGAIKAVVILLDAVRDRLNSGQHGREIVPIMLLEKDSYPHPQFGKTNIPVLNIVDWMSIDGPAPEPAPAEPTPPVDQPRRRRVA
jgi:hypothetical protein